MLMALIQNIAILISFSVLYHFTSQKLKGKPGAISVVNGALLGVTAILTMLTPFQFEPGVFYDARSIIIGTAGFFGTPITAIIATVIAVAFRIALGGSGVIAGSLSILSAAIIASVGRRLRGRFESYAKAHPVVPFAGTWLLGLIIHVFVMLSQLALPDEKWRVVMPLMAFPYLVIFPVAFALICLLFLENEQIARATVELVESEARYRTLFENHHTVMLIIDPSTGAIIDANPAAEDFYGWNRAVLRTMRIHEINTLNPDEVEQEIQQARFREKNVFYFKHRRAHEEPVDVEVYSGPIILGGKELLFSIVHDDSKRVQAERDLKKLAESLEEQVQSRTRDLEAQKNELSELNAETEAFEYSISHDLRAPLRAIAGFSSILKESMNTTESSNVGELNHLVDRIHSNALNMQKLIDDMLMLSRIGSRVLQRQSFDLTQTAKNLINDYIKEYSHRRFKIHIEENMFVCADRDLAQILLANLISNAVKFTKDCEIARIEVASTIRNGKKVYYVKDNGAGFDAEAAHAKTFVPFQRFHESSEFEGTGIGLSIVKRVAKRHGGSVEVESMPGKGATFYFDFSEEQ